MYWVFRMAFQNGQTFLAFPGIPGVPPLLPVDPEGFQWIQMVSEWSGCTWALLDATGGVRTSSRYVWAVPEHLVLGM